MITLNYKEIVCELCYVQTVKTREEARTARPVCELCYVQTVKTSGIGGSSNNQFVSYVTYKQLKLLSLLT